MGRSARLRGDSFEEDHHGQDRPQAPRAQEEGREPREAPQRLTNDQVTDSTELLGRTATRELVVSGADTAEAVGSGSLPVLGTPVLLAWCEAATCAALDLPEGSTSVGTRVSLEHLAASPVGATVVVTATVTYVDGRLVRFAVEARMGDVLVGSGEITRVIVDAARFMARL